MVIRRILISLVFVLCIFISGCTKEKNAGSESGTINPTNEPSITSQIPDEDNTESFISPKQ